MASKQNQEVHRQIGPYFAASDIFAKSPLTIATGSDWAVQPAIAAGASALQEVIGIARDDQAQGQAVAVYDDVGSIIRVIAGATVLQRQNIGVTGGTNYLHSVSSLTATTAFYGPVSSASGTGVYRIGVALESANPGQQFALRFSPSQLSGLS
jgi:hypothetical protein